MALAFVDFKLMDFYLVGATSEFYSLQMSQLGQMQHSYNTHVLLQNGVLLFKIGDLKSSLIQTRVLFHK